MPRLSQAFLHSENIDTNSPEARLFWLRETEQLNFSFIKLRILATQITQLQHSDIGKALAVHNHVKSLPFGCVANFTKVKASDIAKQGYGDCHTKGLLFVALLRAVQIPARLRFVTMSTQFLNGLIDTGTQTMVHAVGEVYLDGKWRQNDTYVVDATFEASARSQLRLEQRILGYGIHAMGDKDWNGVDHAHCQYTLADPDSLPVIDWGVTHDPAHFYNDDNHAGLRHSFTTRVKWTLGANIVNRKVALIREREHDRASSMFDSLSPKLD
jgi:hypothetical protein